MLIYKYELTKSGTTDLDIPKNAQILCIQSQRNIPVAWVAFDKSAPMWKRRIAPVYTGDGIENARYIGTVQLDGGSLVIHYFEEFEFD